MYLKNAQQIDLNLFRKEQPMSIKMKTRIKKMNFQKQERKILEELSDDDKYIIAMAGYQKLIGKDYEDIPRFARGATRP